MKKLFTHLLITLIASLVLFSSLTATPVQAEVEDWPTQDYPGCREFSSPNGQKGVCSGAFFLSGIVSNESAAVEQILGAVPGVTVTADVWQRNPKHAQRMMEQAAVPKIGNYIAMMYANPPADLALWIHDTGQTLGFIPKQTFAQGPGIGFSGLAPLLPLWKVFRNIAYLLLAIVMIVIGFMVMFRKKIDPKTVVTVQNALPKIIITLLLITFSYAIVGFMIDLMYLLILLAVSIFKQTTLLPNPTGLVVSLSGHTTPEGLYTQGGLWANVDALDFNPWKLLLGQNWDPNIANTVAGVGGLLIAAAGFALAGGPIGAIPGGVIAIGMPLASLLISLAALFLIIRLFAFFLGAYIKIIVALIFGPVEILFEAIPGTNSFSNWFRNLLANILVFPIGAVMFMLSAVFIKISSGSGDIWHPPYASLLVTNITSVASWVAIGIMFAIPTVTNQIQELLKAKPLFSAGPEGITGAVSHPTLLAWQVGQFISSHGQMEKIAKAVGSQGGGQKAPQ